MICQISIVPLAIGFWRSQFQNVNWKETFKISRRFCITNKIREVSYKIVHRIYPVKQVIAKFCKDIDLKCVFCKEENESIVHLAYFMIVFIQKYFGVIWFSLLNTELILNCNSKKRMFYFFMSILLISKYGIL